MFNVRLAKHVSNQCLVSVQRVSETIKGVMRQPSPQNKNHRTLRGGKLVMSAMASTAGSPRIPTP